MNKGLRNHHKFYFSPLFISSAFERNSFKLENTYFILFKHPSMLSLKIRARTPNCNLHKIWRWVDKKNFSGNNFGGFFPFLNCIQCDFSGTANFDLFFPGSSCFSWQWLTFLISQCLIIFADWTRSERIPQWLHNITTKIHKTLRVKRSARWWTRWRSRPTTCPARKSRCTLVHWARRCTGSTCRGQSPRAISRRRSCTWAVEAGHPPSTSQTPSTASPRSIDKGETWPPCRHPGAIRTTDSSLALLHLFSCPPETRDWEEPLPHRHAPTHSEQNVLI